jgi:predicted GNAT family N-acyltransferase
MWPNKPLSYVQLVNDSDGLHYGLFSNNQLVSVVSLFIDGNKAQFRKFATLQKEQGNGFGTKLLQFMFDQIDKSKVLKVWCNARIEKTTFYRRFGMLETNETFQKGGKDYVIMEMYL